MGRMEKFFPYPSNFTSQGWEVVWCVCGMVTNPSGYRNPLLWSLKLLKRVWTAPISSRWIPPLPSQNAHILQDILLNTAFKIQRHNLNKNLLNTHPNKTHAHMFYIVLHASEFTINKISEPLQTCWQCDRQAGNAVSVKSWGLVCAWWQFAILLLTGPLGPNWSSRAGNHDRRWEMLQDSDGLPGKEPSDGNEALCLQAHRE